jgi:hypothetical protein
MNIDFCFLGFLHGVRREFPDDVSGAAVSPIFTSPLYKAAPHSVAHLRSDLWPVKTGPIMAPETSSENSSRTPCKNPNIKNRSYQILEEYLLISETILGEKIRKEIQN